MNNTFDKEPILNLDPPYLQNKRAKLRKIRQAGEFAFNGNDDWRAKQSYQKQTEALEKEIKQDEKKIRDQYRQDIESYKSYMHEIETLKDSFNGKSPIYTISIDSDSVSMDSDLISEIKSEEADINPIQNLDL
ncbi:MAG: hypothetical protein WC119_01410 [Synergistaceae bacterium]